MPLVPTEPGRRSPGRAAGFRRLAAVLTLPALLAGPALVTATSAHAGVLVREMTLTGQYSDGALDWIVPAGTDSVTITAVGGSGANGGRGFKDLPSAAGGHGAIVRAHVAVVPGELLSLLPGAASQGPAGGAGTAPGSRHGGTGATTTGQGGNGGGGGGATAVMRGTRTLVVAGGGGGAGGAGVDVGGAGGAAGTDGSDGSGVEAAPGGHGNIPSSDIQQDGEDSPSDQLAEDDAGAGGGGGAGWNGADLGGGRAGSRAGALGIGGGGGGAGGLSFAIDPAAAIGAASSPGDGYVVLTWTPRVVTTSTLSGPSTVPQGTPATLTVTVASPLGGMPSPTGSVTFQEVNVLGDLVRTVLGVVPLSDGQATLTTDPGRAGLHAYRAVYSGDTTFQASTSDFAFATVTAQTLTVTPDPVAFGSQVLGKVTTRTITLTNTGNVDWFFESAGSDNAAVSLASQPCAGLAPGGHSCTATVAFTPSATGPVNATLTFTSNFGTTSITVTGTGVAARPVVTAISPARGRVAGGTVVTITGRSFTGVTAIRTGTVAMTSVSCSSSTRCTAVTARGTGTKDVRVVAAGGTSAAVAADRFTYVR
jgi:hypothetical protein